jgi:alkanesulfonate monooxygenase SsuD/methylene tetrahydromethanopterin reductase-like flavin-dependent oxidoreductase (luciferase family)
VTLSDLRFSVFSVQDHYPDGDRSARAYYNETLENMVLAEKLGFETYWVAEHHFHEYGIIPNAAVFLAAASQRTSTIGLGVAVSVLPFRNAILTAEDYAMVDTLSGGRLRLGVGSGYLKHEFHGFRLTGDRKRERFDAGLEALETLLAGEALDCDEEFVRADNVTLNLPPVQKGGPPVHVAVLRREVAWHVGRAGRHMLSVPYATVTDLKELKGIVDDYARGWSEGGHPGPAPDISFAFHAYMADSDEQACEEAEVAFDAYVNSRLYGKSAGWDEITSRGYCLFGGPETIEQRLTEMHALGIRNIMLLADFGGLAQEKVHKSMRAFARYC